jgi:hypothetical protein
MTTISQQEHERKTREAGNREGKEGYKRPELIMTCLASLIKLA